MKNSGYTLIELIIATLLVMVIFIASTALYVTGVKFFNSMSGANSNLDAFYAIEPMTRHINIGNFAVVTGNDLSIRADYAPDGVTCRNTPNNFLDDTWFKYRFIGNRLRYRTDLVNAATPNNPGAPVNGADPEVVAGLVINNTAAFSMQNPSLQNNPDVVQILLVTGAAPPFLTVRTWGAVSIMPKN